MHCSNLVDHLAYRHWLSVRFAVIALVVLLIGHGPRVAPSCILIEPFILLYGKDAVIAWAKAKGYTDAQIADVQKRCEKHMRR